MNNYNGLILLNKPGDITSFRVLNTIKKALSSNKIGHTGTLDKFATGLIVALSGQATKLARFFTEFDKEYEGTILFGKETDTLDIEGSVIYTAPPPSIETIKTVLPAFLGEINQVPPIFSAVHINGERSYKKARKGEGVNPPARQITIKSLDIINWTSPSLTLKISCSKGTYIRSLARDIGLACGSRGFLESLKRTRVGPLNVSAAVDPEDFNPQLNIMPLKDAAALIPGIVKGFIKREYYKSVNNGLPLKEAFFLSPPCYREGDIISLLSERGDLLGLARAEENGLLYVFVVPEAL